MKVINAAFAAGRLKALPEPYEDRLKRQAAWLLDAAGIQEQAFINEGVDPNRLDIVVTTSDMIDYTGCGRGNAIYDPDLDAIFIDRDLVLPDDIFMIGESYAGSLVGPENTDLHYSYVGFILAHELGHRHAPEAAGRTAAFFHYAALGDGDGNRSAEEAADRFAVETLIQGITSLGPLDFIEYHDALSVIGLEYTELSPMDLAAAEVLGAVYMMSEMLLFSSTPYSPFHFDKEHPSFVERSLSALNRIREGSSGQIARSHLSFFLAQAAALREISSLAFRELYLDEPLLYLAYRDDQLWFGTHELPRRNRSRIYRVPSSELNDSAVVTTRRVFAEFEAPLGSDLSSTDWLDEAFTGEGTTAPLEILSHPIMPPADATAQDQSLTLPSRYEALIRDNGLKVEAAIRAGDVWYIPGIPAYGDSGERRWSLWRYRSSGDLERLVERPFLLASVTGPAEGVFLRDHDPFLLRLEILSDGRIIAWFHGDALYLIDPELREVTLFFTPVRSGLQLLQTPTALVIWTYNCRKIYVAELTNLRESAR